MRERKRDREKRQKTEERFKGEFFNYLYVNGTNNDKDIKKKNATENLKNNSKI